MKLTIAEINILEHAASLPAACASLDRSENQTRKLAQKAVKDGRLSGYAVEVWRGWLGLNGEVASRVESPPAPEGVTSSFLPDESLLAAPETPLAGVEQVFDARPALPSKADVLKRLQGVPDDATYADIVQLYRDGRTMKDSHAALRRFVTSRAAELPPHVVKLVAPKAVVRVTDLTYTQTVDKLARMETEVEQLGGIVQVLGWEVDLLTTEAESRNMAEEHADVEPPFSLAAVLWPVVAIWSLTRETAHRTIAVARRVPRAVARFADIVRGKE